MNMHRANGEQSSGEVECGCDQETNCSCRNYQTIEARDADSEDDSRSRDFNRRSDPFLPENRIPLPRLPSGYGLCEDADCSSSGDSVCDDPVYKFVISTVPNGHRGRRRNERERQRVRSVNEGFERLRRFLPAEYIPLQRYCRRQHQCENGDILQEVEILSRRRSSKVDILRAAIAYIRYLQQLLNQ